MEMSKPSRRRSRAARVKLSTPFKGKIVTVLAKKKGDTKRVLKGVATELAVAGGHSSGLISIIRDARRSQVSGLQFLDLYCLCEGHRGKPPEPLEELRGKVIVVNPING